MEAQALEAWNRVRKFGGGPAGVSPGPPYQISRPVSRVLCGTGRERLMRDGHSSATPVARRLKQPTRTADPDKGLAFRPVPSLFGLAPGGVCRAASVAGDAVRSYRTVSPLPRFTQRAAAVCSLWHCPWGLSPQAGTVPAGCYPAPFVRGARTFLPGSLSALAGAAVRPTDNDRDGAAAGLRQEAGCAPCSSSLARAASSLPSVSRVDVSARPST